MKRLAVLSIVSVLASANCFDAFTYDYMDNKIAPALTTQVQAEPFFLWIKRTCQNVKDVNFTLIDKNSGKELSNYNLDKITPTAIRIVSNTINRDVLVHFSYNKVNYLTGKTTHKEENSTDDFAIRPSRFIIQTPSSVVEGHNMKWKLNVVDFNGNLSKDYYNSSENLDIDNSDTDITIRYNFLIKNGSLYKSQFIFNRPSNMTYLTISEKRGKEYAKVDEKDTSDFRRYIVPAKSDLIKVSEYPKIWLGIGTGDKENNPSTLTINSNIRQNVNMDSSYTKVK